MTSSSEVGARLVLSGGPAFKAEADSAAASVTELGDATAKAGAKARGAGPAFTGAGKRIQTTGLTASTAGKRITAFGDKMVVAGNKTAAAGRKMTHLFTLPVIAVGAVSVAAATKFNASMTRIQTQAGASAKDVKILSKDVLNMAKTAQQGPEVLAESLYHLKSVGMDNVDAMKALGQASKLAAVSGAPLEDTTNALAGAWRTGIKGAGSFSQAVSTLNAVVGAGNMKMADLNAALGTGILPSAKTFGLSLKDVGASLALFTDEGVPAQAAATRLRMTFSLLGAPTDQARKQLKMIGLSQYALASDMRKPNGLVRAIGDLKDHLTDPKYHKSLNEQSGLLSRAFGGGRSSSAILSMINNYDVLVKKQQQVTRSTGKFGAAVAAQAKTPQAQFKLLEARLQRLSIILGDKLLPYVLKGVTWISRMMDRFNGLSDSTKKWIGYGVLALATIGPILSIGGKLVTMVGLLTKAIGFLVANPILLLVVALAVGLYLLYKRSATFRHAVQEVAKALMSLGKDILNKWLIPAFHTLQTVIRNVMGWVQKHKVGLMQIARVILAIVVFAIKTWINYLKILVSVFAWIVKKIWAFGKGVVSVVVWIVKFIKKHWRGLIAIFGGPIGIVVDIVTKNFHTIVSAALWLWKWIRKIASSIWKPFGDAIHVVWVVIKKVFDWFKPAIDGVMRAFRSMGDFIGKIMRAIGRAISKITGPIKTIANGVGSVVHGAGSLLSHIGLATGGTAPGGWTWVGEKGPELMHLPGGTKVINHHQSVNTMQRLNKNLTVEKASTVNTTRNTVTRKVEFTPYQMEKPISIPVENAGTGDRPIVLQVAVDKKVIAEATYDHTRDKVARK